MQTNLIEISQPAILAIAPDVSSLIEIRSSTFEYNLPVVVVEDFEDAGKLIANLQHRIVGIFLQISDSLRDGISVIREAKLSRPLIPLYVIEGKTDILVGLGLNSLRSLGVAAALRKPLNAQQLDEIVGHLSLSNRAGGALAYVGRDPDSRSEQVSESNSEYFPVHALDFMAGEVYVFDIYFKINDQKYLKIIHAGDEFKIARIEAYIKKGTSFFYIQRKSQESYLKFCDYVISLLVP